MSRHLATVARKKRGRNLEQSRAPGGWPSALTGWVERERERKRERQRERGTEADRQTEGDG